MGRVNAHFGFQVPAVPSSSTWIFFIFLTLVHTHFSRLSRVPTIYTDRKTNKLKSKKSKYLLPS